MGVTASTASTNTSSGNAESNPYSLYNSHNNNNNNNNNNNSTLNYARLSKRSTVMISSYNNPNDPMLSHITRDLPHHIIERKQVPGSGRLMSTYRIRHVESGAVMVLKVMVLRIDTTKRKKTEEGDKTTPASSAASPSASSSINNNKGEYGSITEDELKTQNEELSRILELLAKNDAYNILPYQSWFVSSYTDSNGNNNDQNVVEKTIYLLRSHTYATLSSRIVTRPFLSNSEKMFIAHQIISALDKMHRLGLCHGHLTCENIGLSSWNGVFLLDVLPLAGGRAIRPVTLTDDDPSDWIHFFQERSGVTEDGNDTTSGVNDSTTNSNQRFNSGGGNGEKKCYLAPERFTNKSDDLATIPKKLTPAMDIFSLGCVLMELFLNGEPAMDLGDLMEYRRIQGSIADHSTLPQKLLKIESGRMRAAVRHMLNLDPEKRLNAGEYLKRLMGNGGGTVAPLPPCHKSVFFPLMKRLRNEVLSPDARIAIAAMNYERVVLETVGLKDIEGGTYFRKLIGTSIVKLYKLDDAKEKGDIKIGEDDNPKGDNEKSKQNLEANVDDREPMSVQFPQNPSANLDTLLEETENLLQQIELITAGRDEFLHCHTEDHTEQKLESESSSQRSTSESAKSPSKGPTPSSDALILFVQFILSTIRHTQRPSSKLIGMQLLLRLAKYSTDDVRLQRIVPTIVSILHDIDASVRSMAITVLASVLAQIDQFPPSDAQLFPRYILKEVSHLINDPVLMVRVSFCESIAILAETALRFLDTCHAIKLYETVEGDTPSEEEDTASSVIKNAMESVESAFEDTAAAKLLGSPMMTQSNTMNAKDNKRKQNDASDLRKEEKSDDVLSSSTTALIRSDYEKYFSELQELVARWVVSITTDTSTYASALKQALLKDISRLCHFFGHDGVMACILPQVLAFLNHRRDWQLRAALCKHLPSICVMVGRAATEQFVVPCVETALVDDEEMVITSALHCLASLVEMGLLTRKVLLGSNMKHIQTNRSNQPSRTHLDEKNRNGIIKKYSVLLVYPSDHVRYAASFFVAACCRSIRFPDDEILVLPLVRPFLRYDVQRSRLQTSDGIASCLMSPLTKADFEHRLNKSFQKNIDIIEHDSNGDIDIVARKEVPYGLDHFLTDELCDAYLESLDCYVSMLQRNIGRLESKCNQSSNLRIINTVIDGVQKAAFSCYVQNQKYAELWTNPLPLWYDQLRERESEVAYLRSMSTVSKVYGVTIVQTSNTASHLMHMNENLSCFNPDKAFDDMDEFASDPSSVLLAAASKGEWAALSLIDPALTEISQDVSKLRSLKVPVLPPRLGSLRDRDGRFYSCHLPIVASAHDTSTETNRYLDWKPKVDVLTCSTSPHEHNGPVTRLSVSQDQSFFVSGSHDGTCKVFETYQILDSMGELRSSLTYDGHSTSDANKVFTKINDVSIIENSHSIASGDSNGAVHIWRVDTVSKDSNKKGSSVSGRTMLKKVDSCEGEILSVSHFNTPSASLVTFATQRGIHSWDLRSNVEPFYLDLKPEYGYLTSMAVGNDRHWIVAGSNRGYLALWDCRFPKLVKLWQHTSAAPINRLGTSFAALSGDSYEPKPYVVMGCGLNETSIFDISQGSCRNCFRVLDPALCYIDQSALPVNVTSLPRLQDVKIHSIMKQRLNGSGIGHDVSTIIKQRIQPPEPSIQSFAGRVGTTGENYLVTGGTDGFIRYWDFSSSSKCFTVSGLSSSSSRPIYERVGLNQSQSTLLLCRQLPDPMLNEIPSTNISKVTLKGPIRPETGHSDSILDIKKLEFPMKGILSSSRDNTIKFWR